MAFLMRKPAIVSTHRINYVGYIDEGNRDRTLKLLRQLLTAVLRRWPDVEFLTTVQLGRLMENGSKHLRNS